VSDRQRNPFEGFKIELDPERMEEFSKTLRAKLDELRGRVKEGVDQGRYTKVRISYRGKPVGPDLPMGALLAGEGLALLAFGPLWTLLGNLGARAMLEVQILHEAEELVAQGVDAWLAGDSEKAEARYRDALERRRDDTAALYNLGVLLRVTGRVDEALVVLRKAAMGPEGDPDVAKASELLGRMEGKAEGKRRL